MAARRSSKSGAPQSSRRAGRRRPPNEPTRSAPASAALPSRSSAPRRINAVSVVIQFVAATAIFRAAAEWRVMDADEGHFLRAIRGVYDGLVPCQDLFYQQTPLFPYPY
ncbi:MAG: hypothetical protein V3T70_01990, partial [Phycisphaerae bacterium]